MIPRFGWCLALACLGACGAPSRRTALAPPTTTTAAVPVAVAVPAPIPEPEDPIRGSRPPTPAEARTLARLVRYAARIRGLQFTGPVTIRIADSAAVTQNLDERLDEEDFAEKRALYTALGLLAPDLDLRETLSGVMNEQVVGYYDSGHARLVLRDDAVPASAQGGSGAAGDGAAPENGRMVVVHELVHALQDQVLGLRALHRAPRSIDESNAVEALVEGDATLAMVRGEFPAGTDAEVEARALEHVRESIPGILQRSTRGDTRLSGAPPILREPLLSAYGDGFAFCAKLYIRRGWEGVNRAYTELPTSSEEILHPELYLRGARTVPLELPTFPDLKAAGLTLGTEETLGELESGIYFAMALPRPKAQQAAAGWDGDRVRVVFRPDGTPGAVWLTRWDTDGDAVEATNAARAVMRALPPQERADAAVVRLDRHVFMLRGVPAALHAGLTEAIRQGIASSAVTRAAPETTTRGAPLPGAPPP